MTRLSINVTPLERVGRIAVVLAGSLLLASAGGVPAVVREVLLVLAGLDLVLAGALGHCPLYRRLGQVPPPLRRQS